MRGRPRAPIAFAASLLAAGCSDGYAPDEAPPIPTVAVIATAAPNATGVHFESPRPYGVTTGRPPEAPTPLPNKPDPLPVPVEPTAPNPFVEPPVPDKKKNTDKTPNDGSKVGPLPKGVQL